MDWTISYRVPGTWTMIYRVTGYVHRSQGTELKIAYFGDYKAAEKFYEYCTWTNKFIDKAWVTSNV